VNLVPLQRGGKGENLLMTQYEMHAVADIGLVKEDFLGLTNLTLLENAVKMIEEVRGEKVDLWNLPENDPRTYAMLSNGDTTGVFQMEGAGMRRTVREFRPTTLDHLAAIVALYRPGPMANIPAYCAAKDGRVPITFVHPKLEPILKDTYGVMVFQDQILQIVQAIAGFTLGHADVLRNAMGKKIRAVMEKERDNFMEGAAANGVPTDAAQKIWEYIEPFSGYGFNRAHAYCYANIAYQTAYLKCNYPAEYMAAMLSTQYDDTEKLIAATGECRRLDLEVLPPDVNRSSDSFTVETPTPIAMGEGAPTHQGVRFGLAAVKNVGAGAARTIVEARESGGPFRSLEDFCARIDLRQVNKRTIEALTKAGALDCFGPRERVLAGLDLALGAAQHLQKAAGLGQGSLFGDQPLSAGPASLPNVPPATQQQVLAWEKEAFGFYLTNHPYSAAARALAGQVTTTTNQISEDSKDERVTIAGAVMQVRRVITKKQETMVIARIEDLHGSIEAVVFPRTYAANPSIWREDAIVIVNGKVDVRRVENGGEETRGVAEILVQTASEWDPADAPEDDEEDARAAGTPVPANGVVPTVAPVADLADDEGYDEVPALDEPPAFLNMSGAGTYAAANRAVGQMVDADAADDENAPTLGVAAEAPPAYVAAARRVALVIRESGDTERDSSVLRQLHAVVSRSAGTDPYEIVFDGPAGRRRLVGDAMTVGWTPDLEREVAAILGADAIIRA
jgi:DNA polymerase-3 subunit alpha